MQLAWLDSASPFPPIEESLGLNSIAPGLLAAGGDLGTDRLKQAYRQGIFPWYSTGQPILWWSPDPRMVLRTNSFRIHRSFAKNLRNFIHSSSNEIRIDYDFDAVIKHCSNAQRNNQSGTWILQEIQQAYAALHAQGLAHSIETWSNGQLVGGLYFVAIGRAVFGESMFSLLPNGSKFSLAALVAICRGKGVDFIDCQQVTSHLSSLGATAEPRAQFVAEVRRAVLEPEIKWLWNPLYWNTLTRAPADLHVRHE